MLRSVHLPQGLLQANMVERIQQAQQQHPDMQQRYFEIALAKEKKRAEETVLDSEKAEKEHLVGREDETREEKKRSFDGRNEGRDAGDESVTGGEAADGDDTRHAIDVKV
ncbi:MAG TPA: hypothetical protein ENN35_00590 [Deltaproteobacteria bacterium]|nr:hypothetical protein [Deltaproteobacteria bacterium]